MLHRLSRVLREIHRLSREAPVAEFQDAAFEAMKGLIRFDAAYWGGGREPIAAVILHYVHLHLLGEAKQLAKGASYKDIARALAIAPATVRNHIASIHAKLGSSKGTQVAAMLMSEGWL